MKIESIETWQVPLEYSPAKPRRAIKMPAELFIGVLSAAKNFQLRNGQRKSWMKHSLIKAGNVKAKFFVGKVGPSEPREVGYKLKKEMELYGDIVEVEKEEAC